MKSTKKMDFSDVSLSSSEDGSTAGLPLKISKLPTSSIQTIKICFGGRRQYSITWKTGTKRRKLTEQKNGWSDQTPTPATCLQTKALFTTRTFSTAVITGSTFSSPTQQNGSVSSTWSGILLTPRYSFGIQYLGLVFGGILLSPRSAKWSFCSSKPLFDRSLKKWKSTIWLFRNITSRAPECATQRLMACKAWLWKSYLEDRYFRLFWQ